MKKEQTTDEVPSILKEAHRLTTVDRQEKYGHPAEDFGKVAELTKSILASSIDPRLKHPLYMIQVKIARLLKTPDHRDSIVDIAGYINTYNMVLEYIQEETNHDTGVHTQS